MTTDRIYAFALIIGAMLVLFAYGACMPWSGALLMAILFPDWPERLSSLLTSDVPPSAFA